MVREGYKPLQTFKGVAEIDSSEDVGEWNGKQSVRTFHIFVNHTEEPVDLVWFYEGAEHYTGSIEPGSNLYVGSYTFHQWKVKSKKDGSFLGVHCGQSATVTVRPRGCIISFHAGTADDPDAKTTTRIDTPKGGYAVRAHAVGMPVWAFDCVCEEAVQRAVHVACCMLAGVPASVLARMREQGAALGIFGRDHVVTDLPPHAFMRHNANRDLDTTSRGLGGTPTVPVTSCGEENLTMEGDRFYPCQSILVHELGHAVMNLGMPDATRARLQAAYQAAVRDGLYPPACYMVVNDHEYFATGTEAWFESTIRVDVNGGVKTRAGVRERDPRLAGVLAEMFGDTEWRYHHDCPRPLSFQKSAPSATAAASTSSGAGSGGSSQQSSAAASGSVSLSGSLNGSANLSAPASLLTATTDASTSAQQQRQHQGCTVEDAAAAAAAESSGKGAGAAAGTAPLSSPTQAAAWQRHMLSSSSSSAADGEGITDVGAGLGRLRLGTQDAEQQQGQQSYSSAEEAGAAPGACTPEKWWGCSIGNCVRMATGVAGPVCPGLLSACLLGRGPKAKE